MKSAAPIFSPISPILEANHAHVWRCDLDAFSGAEYEVFLSADERARAASFQFPLHRARYVAARGMLRALLSRYLQRSPEEFRFCVNAHGKPELKKPALEDCALRFNISHSQNAALFAFCFLHDIGVDIEFRRADFDDEKIARLSQRFFCEEENRELESLAGSDKRAAFFRCWTRKESLLKATGEGIAGGLKTYRVSLLPGAAPGVLAPQRQENAWSLCDVSAPEDYAAALAVRAPNIMVREMKI
jgi:4'-phosphopantetheinyl transferase